MTREEQRKEASYEFATKFGGSDPTVMEIAALWFRRGAKWSDEHPDNYDGKAMLHVLNKGVEQGKKEIVNNLWKPADGDDLPEIDRDVIALVGIKDPTATDCFCGYEVVFAHRPVHSRKVKGLSGKEYTESPFLYGAGGWNIPDVKYWLDLDLPKEE